VATDVRGPNGVQFLGLSVDDPAHCHAAVRSGATARADLMSCACGRHVGATEQHQEASSGTESRGAAFSCSWAVSRAQTHKI
jgi:hypothetical protein